MPEIESEERPATHRGAAEGYLEKVAKGGSGVPSEPLLLAAITHMLMAIHDEVIAIRRKDEPHNE